MLIRWLIGLFSPASQNSEGGKSPKIQKSNRQPRIRLLPLHQASVTLLDPPSSGPVSVANVSTTGVGLVRSSDCKWPGVGGMLRGELRLSGTRHPFRAKVVHVSTDVIGCAFDHPENEFIDTFLQFFNLELSALRLHEMNPRALKAEPDGDPRFFQGGGYELFMVTQPHPQRRGRLIRFQLCFLGNYFEAEAGGKLRFGYVEEPNGGSAHRASDLVRFKSTVPPEMIEAAIRFVRNIRDVSAEHQEQIVAMLGSFESRLAS